jgi:hypothetical protein
LNIGPYVKSEVIDGQVRMRVSMVISGPMVAPVSAVFSMERRRYDRAVLARLRTGSGAERLVAALWQGLNVDVVLLQR